MHQGALQVLVVDDELAILDLLSAYLSRHGYEVTTAPCLQQAADWLPFNRFSVIVLDVLFPKGDGLEFLDFIRLRCPSTPVIMMTGIGYDEALLRECVDRGAAGYVSKLLPLDQLLMEIHRVLDFAGAEQ